MVHCEESEHLFKYLSRFTELKMLGVWLTGYM